MLLLVETALAKVDAFCVNLLMHIKRSPQVTNCVCPGLVVLAPVAEGVAPVVAVEATWKGVIS